MFNLFDLLVNYTFGSVLLAIFGVGFLLYLMLILGRLSGMSRNMYALTYIFIMAMFYAPWSAMLVFIVGIVYFVFNLYKWYVGE